MSKKVVDNAKHMHTMTLRSMFVLLLCLGFIDFSNASSKDGDCIFCTQQRPTCGPCGTDEYCEIVEQSCFACSRAVCVNISFQEKPKSCKSHNIPRCRCDPHKTCLISTRTRFSCRRAECVDMPDSGKQVLVDYYLNGREY